MAQEGRQYTRWTDDDLALLSSVIDSYQGRRCGSHCGFHTYLAQKMSRTPRRIARGIELLNRRHPKAFIKPIPPPVLSETEKAYLAALFEGEGCITRFAGHSWQFVFIYNTDARLIEYVRSLVPFSKVVTRPEGTRRKQLWVVRTSSIDGVLWAIRTLRPYCHGRKVELMNQAESELR